jgi:exodeoxyribonuclease-3
MTKIVSWNVNGIQSIVSKDISGNKCAKSVLHKSTLQNLLEKEQPDILCLQEIRCSSKFNHKPYFPGYNNIYTNYSKVRKGYSGTLTATKITPVNVFYDYSLLGHVDDASLNSEGRMITLEFESYYLINVYVPNVGVTDFKRLDWRIQVWESTMQRYINLLQETKPTIIVGDFNCVHKAIDGYKDNLNIAGSTVQEKKAFTELLKECNLRDSFREFCPTDRRYTWFSSKSYTCGLRLDYALVSNNLKLKDANILGYIEGSDHVPIMVEI